MWTECVPGKMLIRGLLAVSVWLTLLPAIAAAEDWPMWRHDAQRSATTPEKLPDLLRLQWVHEFPPLESAWPDQVGSGYMTFDVSYKPIVLGRTMFVGSSLNHRLTALDTETGAERWRFYTEGPIRFAPAAWKDCVCVASDDGYLYCLNAADGALKWRYRAGADHRKIIGNDHLIGLWPVRGGPVIADGIVYFGASIWPFVGAFLCAVDLTTGKPLWVNSGLADFRTAFALQGSGMLVRPGLYGSSPQGYLTVAEQRLAVPQGRNMAQLFDRATGELLFHEIYGMHEEHHPAEFWYALLAGRNVFSGPIRSRGVNIDTAQLSIGNPCGNGIVGDNAIYIASGRALSALDIAPPHAALWKLDVATRTPCPGSYIKAGPHLYLPGANKRLLVVKDADTDRRSPVDGPELVGDEVWDMLAADERLFVVTRDGKIACYGATGNGPKTHSQRVAGPAFAGSSAQADAILDASGQKEGYGLVLGIANGDLAVGLMAKSALRVIAVDPDEKKIAALRKKVDETGQYGARFCALVGQPLNAGLPPYLANLIVSETMDASSLGAAPAKAEILRILRPYGGAACLSKPGGHEIVRREGALTGSAEWTHNNADAGNSMMNFDKLAKPPFGVLWFGGPPNTPMLPRHGRGPAPTVVNGRMFVLGIDVLRAMDIYTGRLLWERTFTKIGEFYNTGAKQLGTHETGPNYAVAADAVYVITPRECIVLDPATGKTIKEFALPVEVEKDSLWASVRVSDDLLVATLRPIDVKRGFAVNARSGAGAQWLAAYDRRSGKALFAKEAAIGYRSNGVAVAQGNVFCIDGATAEELAKAKRSEPEKSVMYAFDGRTGAQIWKTEDDVFGTWLGYSAEQDVVVMAGCGNGAGEPAAMAAHKATDRSRLWRCPAANANAPKFIGPPLIHHQVILPQNGQAIGLLDGKLQTRIEPLTGRQIPWNCLAQGCGFMHGSEHVLLLRAWAVAGYSEVTSPLRLVGLGGFRSGCTANQIAAGGIVTAPEYSRECECQFQNKTSMGLIHSPDADMWSFELGASGPQGRIARLGLNFGAPGDRISDEGTLWLDCPDVGGPSSLVDVTLAPTKDLLRRDWSGDWRKRMIKTPGFGGKTFYKHTSLMRGGPLTWVTASGLTGVTGIKVVLSYPPAGTEQAAYTVRLYFAEPNENAKSGERVFSVKIGGNAVLSDLDVVKEAGGALSGVMKEFKNIHVSDALTVEFVPKTGEPIVCGLEAILER